MSDEETSREVESGAQAVVEEFIVVEIIDIEIYAKEGRKPPHAHCYRIRIDRDYKEVKARGLNGREILALVGKTPEGYLLSRKHHGGPSSAVQADQYVDFTTPGIERFQTLALDPTEG